MGHIKEPEGVDFIVAPGHLSDEDKIAFKNAFTILKRSKGNYDSKIVIPINTTGKGQVIFRPVDVGIIPQQIVFQSVSPKTGKRVIKKSRQFAAKRRKTT